MRSALQVRNGPPEAVSVMLRIDERGSAPRTWNRALCSESSGSKRAPTSAARAITAAPAQTRLSLLASAIARPGWSAAKVASSPAAPEIALTTISAGRSTASSTAERPAPHAIPVPESACLSAAPPAASAKAAKDAPVSTAVRASACASRPPTTVAMDRRPGFSAATSRTERPTEPVAPRSVTLRKGIGIKRRDAGRRARSRPIPAQPSNRRAGRGNRHGRE